MDSSDVIMRRKFICQKGGLPWELKACKIICQPTEGPDHCSGKGLQDRPWGSRELGETPRPITAPMGVSNCGGETGRGNQLKAKTQIFSIHKIKKFESTRSWRGYGEMGTPRHCWWTGRLICVVGGYLALSIKITNTYTLCSRLSTSGIDPSKILARSSTGKDNRKRLEATCMSISEMSSEDIKKNEEALTID